MAWPPTIPPNTRANGTAQNNNHPSDHNAIADALTEIVDRIGEGDFESDTVAMKLRTSGDGIIAGAPSRGGVLLYPQGSGIPLPNAAMNGSTNSNGAEYGLLSLIAGTNDLGVFNSLRVQNTVYAAGVALTSSEKTKTEIADLDLDPDALLRLQPKRFRVTNDPDRVRVGLIAEDVADLLPAVAVDNGGVPGYDLAALVAVLISQVQRLAARLDALERGRS